MFTSSFAYPNLFNPISGRCRVLEDNESIVNRVGCLLKSYKKEEFMFPSFGCTFPDILYKYNNKQQIDKATEDIKKAIIEFEPFVSSSMIVIENQSDATTLRLAVTLVLDSNFQKLAGTIEWSFNQEGVQP